MEKKLEVNCPKCKKRFEYYSSESRPFCSQRCKTVDCGHWLMGEYAIAGAAAPEVLSQDDSEDGEFLH